MEMTEVIDKLRVRADEEQAIADETEGGLHQFHLGKALGLRGAHGYLHALEVASLAAQAVDTAPLLEKLWAMRRWAARRLDNETLDRAAERIGHDALLSVITEVENTGGDINQLWALVGKLGAYWTAASADATHGQPPQVGSGKLAEVYHCAQDALTEVLVRHSVLSATAKVNGGKNGA